MAASLRRERRKRILENREARLRLILGERAEEDEVSVEPVSETTSSKDVPESADDRERLQVQSNFDHEFSHPSNNAHARLGRERKCFLEEEAEKEKALGNSKEMGRRKIHSSSSSLMSNSSTKTKENKSGRSFTGLDQTSTRENMDDLIRIVSNLVLALVLVIYGKRSRLEWSGTASKGSTEDTTGSETQVAYHYQSTSFLWAFLALQMFFLFIPRFRETYHSTFITMVTVAFQLSGVSTKLTSTINLILTSLLRMLSDFCMFVFGVVITYATMDYAESNKLI